MKTIRRIWYAQFHDGSQACTIFRGQRQHTHFHLTEASIKLMGKHARLGLHLFVHLSP